MKEIDTALYTHLAASGTTLYALISTRVFNSLAPQGVAYPLCVYNRQAGGPTNDTPTDFIEEVYQVKGLSASLGVALNVDSAIWDRLHKAVLTVAGWTNVSTFREGPVDYSELVDGVTLFHRGGLYRIRISR